MKEILLDNSSMLKPFHFGIHLKPCPLVGQLEEGTKGDAAATGHKGREAKYGCAGLQAVVVTSPTRAAVGRCSGGFQNNPRRRSEGF